MKIVQKLIQLYPAFLLSSAKSVLLISLNCEHSVNICFTNSFPSPHLHSVSSILGTFRSKKLFQAYFALLHLYHQPANLFKQFIIEMKHSSQSCRCYFVEGTTSCFSSLVIFHSAYNFSTREALTAVIRKRMLGEVAVWLWLISTNFLFILWTFLHLVAFCSFICHFIFIYLNMCRYLS